MLLEFIKEWIHPGTTVVSDCWRACDCLSFVHESVNHSKNFVDPDSRTHTQNIERTWREARGGIPHFGRKEKHMVGYLAEFLFNRKYSYRPRVHCGWPTLFPCSPAVSLSLVFHTVGLFFQFSWLRITFWFTATCVQASASLCVLVKCYVLYVCLFFHCFFYVSRPVAMTSLHSICCNTTPNRRGSISSWARSLSFSYSLCP